MIGKISDVPAICYQMTYPLKLYHWWQQFNQYRQRLLAAIGVNGSPATQNERLQEIVQPLLPQAIWTEAVDLSRQGGRELGMAMRQATILCLDIADFTRLTETVPLSQIVYTLNAYLGEMTGLVYDYGGDIHKFLGDGFLSLFDTADAAVKAGSAIQMATDVFNAQQVDQGGLTFSARIGIDTGVSYTAELILADKDELSDAGVTLGEMPCGEEL